MTMKKPDITTIIDIQNRFRGFMSGIRVVMLIDRGVMNSNKGSKRWINKIITTSDDEWINAVNRLLEMQYYLNEPDIRLYSCLNDRKLDKAIQMFKHKQIDLLPDMKDRFYSRINDSFCSCLMKPENKASKYFMLDIDTKDLTEVEDFVSREKIQVIKDYQTKKGWHYIVSPFNVKVAEMYKSFTVNKDAMMLVHYMESENES